MGWVPPLVGWQMSSDAVWCYLFGRGHTLCAPLLVDAVPSVLVPDAGCPSSLRCLGVCLPLLPVVSGVSRTPDLEGPARCFAMVQSSLCANGEVNTVWNTARRRTRHFIQPIMQRFVNGYIEKTRCKQKYLVTQSVSATGFFLVQRACQA